MTCRVKVWVSVAVDEERVGGEGVRLVLDTSYGVARVDVLRDGVWKTEYVGPYQRARRHYERLVKYYTRRRGATLEVVFCAGKAG